MKKYLGVMICVAAFMIFVSASAFAGNPESFNVTVSISTAASITVTGGPVSFGTMSTGSSLVSSSPVTVKNTGSGSSQTYSLSLSNPAGWSAVTTTPGFNEYRLSGAFDADGTLTWDLANHALTTSSVASSAAKFAGDETGIGVPYNADRHLYLKMETPSGTSSPSQKTIQVTITAAID